MANISYTKSYLLDKYFSELQKFQEKPPQELAAFLRQQQHQQAQERNNEQAPDKPLPKPPPSPNYVNQQQTKIPAPIEDLVHLKGNLITEDSLIKCLERIRDTNGYVHCGPQLVLFNTPNSPQNSPLPSFTAKVLASCTTAPQTVIFSGCCGSGKTHAMLQLVKEMFKQAAPNGPEVYRGLQASLTVARAMGSVKCRFRGECSRVGHYVDLQLSSKTITRAKLHLYFLDNSRLTRRAGVGGGGHGHGSGNYRVFYQLLAGLTLEEKRQLHLDRDHYTYLGVGQGQGHREHDESTSPGDAVRFGELRDALKELGIPFWEVLRLLAAILLLGEPNSLSRIASLLDVRESVLRSGLETRTTSLNGQLINSQCDTNYSKWMRDQLAKSLYVRTFGTIIRRANNVGRGGRPPPSGTFSASEYSTDSRPTGAAHSHSNFSLPPAKEAAMTALNNFIRSTTDNSIGILDLYGYEQGPHLESLCVNLAAETMQHFYNTHVFKTAMEAMREELELQEFGFEDNVPVIDLVSSLRTGLLSILDSLPPTASAETYLSQVAAQHAGNSRLEVDVGHRSFIVQHFAGRVEYDVTDFAAINRDHLPDDIVAVFHKQNCSFGFASHLFSTELKILTGPDPHPRPRGLIFRVTPSHSSASRDIVSSEPISTLTQDFHTRLDNLLRTLVHARPHFVRCFRVDGLREQMRAFQLLETVEFYVAGFPNKSRLRMFAAKYGVNVPLVPPINPAAFGKQMGAPQPPPAAISLSVEEACRTFLESKLGTDGSGGCGWAVGKKHVFLSEPARQVLETDLAHRRVKAATVIQRKWKRWRRLRQQKKVAQAGGTGSDRSGVQGAGNVGTTHSMGPIIASVASTLTTAAGATTTTTTATPTLASPLSGSQTGRPAPIAGSPKLEGGLVERTCQMFGLDKDRPPALPQPRTYTVKGATKFGYPQLRVMRSPFPDLANPVLQRKELVSVVGISNSKPGHLIVDKNGNHLQVPFQYLEFGCKEGVE